MKSWTFASRDEEETARLGAALAGCLPRRALVTLDGTLGAGKTRLVRGLAVAAGIDSRAVVSPTFTLVNEYVGPTPIFHFDAYRMRDEQEFLDLGFEEYLERDGWCLVEWSDRVTGCLPDERLEVRIAVSGSDSREVLFVAHGEECVRVIERLEESLK